MLVGADVAVAVTVLVGSAVTVGDGVGELLGEGSPVAVGIGVPVIVGVAVLDGVGVGVGMICPAAIKSRSSRGTPAVTEYVSGVKISSEKTARTE